MKPAIVVGNVTSHGGVIQEGESRWLVDGKAAHLGGMSHYCPKCKILSKAIPDPHSLNIFGKLLIVAGNKSTCGSEYLPQQNLVVVDVTSARLPSTLTNNSSFLPSQSYFDEQFLLKTDEGDLLVDTPYTIKMIDGSLKKGVSDAEGKTERIQTEKAERLELYIGHIE
jgi:uncharacterized Zn-binding protein involved in type VI secretion